MLKMIVFTCLLTFCAVGLSLDVAVKDGRTIKPSKRSSDDFLRNRHGYRTAFEDESSIRGFYNALGQLCFSGQIEGYYVEYQGATFGKESHSIDIDGICYVNGRRVSCSVYNFTGQLASQVCAFRTIDAYKRKFLGLPPKEA